MMMSYVALIRSVLPSFQEKHLTKRFSEIGIESFDLLSIRVVLENNLSKTIPDEDWLSFESFQDVTNYCNTIDTRTESIPTYSTDSGFEKVISINMPQMSIEGLSENWLFKELGDTHWSLLSKGLKTNSSLLQDDLGNRLYATFVRIRVQSSCSFDQYEENEAIRMSGSIQRHGNSTYFTDFNFLTTKDRSLNANLMTTFSIRESIDNDKLAKSQPSTKDNTIPNLEIIPKFSAEYLSVKKRELDQIDLSSISIPLKEGLIFETKYHINPYYDLNGVGLLYFAAYPIVSDTCEARYFNQDTIIRWEENWFTSSRDIMYYANCNLSDTIIYQLNHFEYLTKRSIVLVSSLFRKSDNECMAKIMTIKHLKS